MNHFISIKSIFKSVTIFFKGRSFDIKPIHFTDILIKYKTNNNNFFGIFIDKFSV